MGHLYLSVDLHLITKYVSASKEKGTGNTTHTQMKHTWLAGGGWEWHSMISLSATIFPPFPYQQQE